MENEGEKTQPIREAVQMKKLAKNKQSKSAVIFTPKRKKSNKENSDDPETSTTSGDEIRLDKDDVEIFESGSDEARRGKASSLRKSSSLCVEDEEPIIWGFVLPLVPKPDMSEEIETLNEQYSLSNLLKKMKKLV
jgi:hypothetical protein